MAAATRAPQCLLGFSRSAPPLPTIASLLLRRRKVGATFVRMASSDAAAPQASATVAVPGAAGPVCVVAAPGLPEADFRKAIESALFRQWLENLQSEEGVLAYGKLSLKQILIQGVDMFGERVGFLKFKADIIDEETKTKVPGIVFARGPVVAVLILLESKGQTYAVLTEQARVPIGKFVFELPAGMLDDEKGDFVGTAVREVPGIVFARGPAIAVLILLESKGQTYAILTEQARVPVNFFVLEVPEGMLHDEKSGLLGTAVREVEEETGIKLNLEDMVDLSALLDPDTGCRMLPSPVSDN